MVRPSLLNPASTGTRISTHGESDRVPTNKRDCLLRPIVKSVEGGNRIRGRRERIRKLGRRGVHWLSILDPVMERRLSQSLTLEERKLLIIGESGYRSPVLLQGWNAGTSEDNRIAERRRWLRLIRRYITRVFQRGRAAVSRDGQLPASTPC
jgi:hypothetical protein